MKELGIGSAGPEVEALQLGLEMAGYDPGPVDGDFGPRTEHAVRRFQAGEMVTGRVDAATLTRLADVLREQEAGLHKMTVPVPYGLDGIREVFGSFPWTAQENGFIEIPKSWIKANLTKAVLPVVGKRWVHRKMASVFDHVLGELRNRGLGSHIQQFDIWCARYKNFDPSRNLSTHAWGIACDVNWGENPIGREGNIDPGIVRVFERHGFQWGGRWRYRDDMHFQYCRGY
jgi:hypothetical protein